MSIYQARAARLLRLANPGDGASCCREDLRPELLDLLTDELTKTAAQVLNMCIRAIDYLPPVDITFGDYLRAILTADYDLVKDDKYNYRLAFIESFRSWGVKLSDNIRNSSEDSLLWQSLDPLIFGCDTDELAELLAEFVREDFQYAEDRGELFRVTSKWKWRVADWLRKRFANRKGFDKLLGLDLDGVDAKGDPKTFYVRALRRVERLGPQGRPLPQAVLQVTQTFQKEAGVYCTTGSSLIVNTLSAGVDYIIVKNANSTNNSVDSAAFGDDSLRSTYFGSGVNLGEPFAALHNDEENN